MSKSHNWFDNPKERHEPYERAGELPFKAIATRESFAVTEAGSVLLDLRKLSRADFEAIKRAVDERLGL